MHIRAEVRPFVCVLNSVFVVEEARDEEDLPDAEGDDEEELEEEPEEHTAGSAVSDVLLGNVAHVHVLLVVANILDALRQRKNQLFRRS